ncbi:hypothetical protein ACFE04_016693 [Oxalis oulophora]
MPNNRIVPMPNDAYPLPQRAAMSQKKRCITVIAMIFLLSGFILPLLALGTLKITFQPKSPPEFTIVDAAILQLNTTTTDDNLQLPVVTSSLGLTIVTRNVYKRTSLRYEDVRIKVEYENQEITARHQHLKPFFHKANTTLTMSPVVGGYGVQLASSKISDDLAADIALGVVPCWVTMRTKSISWILMRWVWFNFGDIFVTCYVRFGFKGVAKPFDPVACDVSIITG